MISFFKMNNRKKTEGRKDQMHSVQTLQRNTHFLGTLFALQGTLKICWHLTFKFTGELRMLLMVNNKDRPS